VRSQQALRSGEWKWDPLILDDQAILLHVRDKGLVVLTTGIGFVSSRLHKSHLIP
jgi:hypothetical protein